MDEHRNLKLPEVTFQKNGYQIRQEILSLATSFMTQEYQAKYMGWEVSQTRNDDGSIITSVSMPEFPGLDKILETAEKMYNFVNCNHKR